MAHYPSGYVAPTNQTRAPQQRGGGPGGSGGRRVLIDWAAANAQLPSGNDHASKSARRKLFSQFDPNGNGILSLAEVDRGLKTILQLAGASECTPAINRAFAAARDMVPPVASFSNSYIDRNEFRFFLVYLRYYIELWEFFDMIDTSNDRRLSLREFQAALPFLQRWNLKISDHWAQDPRSAFAQIDRNGGGVVLFDEFADFCLRHCLDQASSEEDDAQDRQEALKALRQKPANVYGQGQSHSHGHTSTHMATTSAAKGASQSQTGPLSAGIVDWDAIRKTMPIGRDSASKQIRNRLFSQFDPNGNGILSLAEVDRGLKTILNIAGAGECTPAINRAFHAARDYAPPVANFSSDYVDKNEFRVLLVYLRHYIELWEHFRAVDTSGDRRVKFKEFQASLPLLRKWNLRDIGSWEADPRAAFGAMDANGGGVILFDEFADCCLRHGMNELSGSSNQNDDLEDRREALEHLQKGQPHLCMSNTQLPPTTSREINFGQGPVASARSLQGPTINSMVDKASLNSQLPIARDQASKRARASLFSRFDPNGNGILSLAEVDRGLKTILQLVGIDNCTPAINRAFHAARDIAPPVASFSADYIDKNEFRVLLVYLRHYIELFELFAAIDTSGDRRVRIKEFQAALPTLDTWGVRQAKTWAQDPRGTFAKMDRNGGGVVLFDEFADFALRNGLRDLDGDDTQDRKEALEELLQRQPNLTTKNLPQMREVNFGSATTSREIDFGQGPVASARSLQGPTIRSNVDKASLNAQLPIARDPASKRTRASLFSRFDPNGNGILSLAEVDKGVKQILQLVGIENCTPAINRAFHAARDIAPPVASFSTDYIDKNEFRVLLVYLRHYVELFQLFSSIDTSGDRRVRMQEFQAALPMLDTWGVRQAKSWAQDPRGSFARMDANGGGVVLFDEFADFVLRHGLRDLDGDDSQDRKEALEELIQRQPNLTTKNLPHMRELNLGATTATPRQIYPGATASPQSSRMPFDKDASGVQQALRGTPQQKLPTWDTTYKRTFNKPSSDARSPRALGSSIMSPGKQSVRSKLDQQMEMYNTDQLNKMLAFANRGV